MSPEFRRIARFGITGCLNTAADWLAFFLLSQAAGLAAPPAQAAGYLAGTVNSWLLNRLWVFRGDGQSGGGPAPGAGAATGGRKRQAFAAPVLARFLAVNGTVSLATALVMQGLAGTGLPLLPSKIVVTLFGMAANYLLYRFWVFARPDTSAEAPR
jgi:putative flippase GtrA